MVEDSMMQPRPTVAMCEITTIYPNNGNNSSNFYYLCAANQQI